jgi:hypothetical protein
MNCLVRFRPCRAIAVSWAAVVDEDGRGDGVENIIRPGESRRGAAMLRFGRPAIDFLSKAVPAAAK